MENDEALRLRISADMKAELQKLADKEKRKLSDYIRLGLEQMIAQSKTSEITKHKEKGKNNN